MLTRGYTRPPVVNSALLEVISVCQWLPALASNYQRPLDATGVYQWLLVLTRGYLRSPLAAKTNTYKKAVGIFTKSVVWNVCFKRMDSISFDQQYKSCFDEHSKMVPECASKENDIHINSKYSRKYLKLAICTVHTLIPEK